MRTTLKAHGKVGRKKKVGFISRAKEIIILIVMTDKPELPPASQTGDDQTEIEIEATQETGVDSKCVVAYGQPDRESLHLLLSLSPSNSLRYDRTLRSLGEGESGENVKTTNDAQDANMAITPLSSSQGDSKSQEQPKENNADSSNCRDRESTAASSDEEPLRKPVEATDTPTGGTSALVPSSSPPKSHQYLNDLAKLLKTYDIVDNPSPALIDPADQHRNVNARATKKVKRQLTRVQSRDRSSGAVMESIEGIIFFFFMLGINSSSACITDREGVCQKG